MRTVPAAVALGSNLGDRRANLLFAVARLRLLMADVRVSRLFDTAPVGFTEQPRFLNAALVGLTGLGARDLLSALLTIEGEAGRERPFPGAPRTLDLDLILYGGQQISEPGLLVPHPRFRGRRFVLEPLAEVAPSMIDPVTGMTVQELLEACP